MSFYHFRLTVSNKGNTQLRLTKVEMQSYAIELMSVFDNERIVFFVYEVYIKSTSTPYQLATLVLA